MSHKVEQTANNTTRKDHITVLLYRNQLIHRIDVHNLRITQHKELTTRNLQIIRHQIQRSVVRFRLQLDIVVVFLFHLIVKILSNLTTIADLIMNDIIFDETACCKVNHHRLNIQRRFIEPANHILNGKILITSTIEELPEGI